MSDYMIDKTTDIPFNIAVTSGKGGTGKTTVSTGLFYVLNKLMNIDSQLIDCDVEEPDCNIFLKAPEISSHIAGLSIPRIDPGLCSFCGRCKDICAFNAIVMLPPAGFIEVSEDMCHGCGACAYVCQDKAITEYKKTIGRVSIYNYNNPGDFIEGRLNIGVALQTHVIRETLRHRQQKGIIILDSPPGTSCPVIAVISKADYVIMVTEPGPFGLHDLKLMAETVRQTGKECGIVINKSGVDFPPLYNYIKETNIPLLAEIPFSREFAEIYSKGGIPASVDRNIEKIFREIIIGIQNHCKTMEHSPC